MFEDSGRLPKDGVDCNQSEARSYQEARLRSEAWARPRDGELGRGSEHSLPLVGEGEVSWDAAEVYSKEDDTGGIILNTAGRDFLQCQNQVVLGLKLRPVSRGQMGGICSYEVTGIYGSKLRGSSSAVSSHDQCQMPLPIQGTFQNQSHLYLCDKLLVHL